MARTNYSYGKRLRELAKKQKREEKLQRRKERKEAAAAGVTLDEYGNPISVVDLIDSGDDTGDDEAADDAGSPDSDSED